MPRWRRVKNPNLPPKGSPERKELMARIKRDPQAYVEYRIQQLGVEDVDALLKALSMTEGLDDE